MRVKNALRYELKYLLDQRQHEALLALIGERMTPDRFGDSHGAYSISSIYFDTPDYKAYWDKLEGHKVRRKVRVRSYGASPVDESTPVYLEIKQRVNKLMAKRRVRLPYATAMTVAGADSVLADNLTDADGRGVVDEVRYLREVLRLQPACLVRYDRLAFEGGDHFPDLRVTFDNKLQGTTRSLSLTHPDLRSERQILPPNRTILEVKVNHTVPSWLADLLRAHGCILQRISKYCATLEKNAVINLRQRLVTADSPY